MKLSKPSRFTSFYESFSDLIFGTMAMFVLIVVVLAIQVRPEGIPKDVYQEVKKEVAEIRKLKEQLEQKIDELEKEGKPQPLDLVVAVDGSGSMGVALENLRSATLTIADAMPMVSPDVNIGIVVYGNPSSDGGPSTEIFQLTKIAKIEEDQIPYRKLFDFTQNAMQPSRGWVDVTEAVKLAISMFQSRPSSESRKRTLMIVGDMGPYETGTFLNEDGEKEIVKLLKNWKTKNPKGNIIAVYNEPDERKMSREVYQWLISQRDKTRNLFQQMAIIGGDENNFSNQSSRLLPLLLKGVLN